MKAGMGDMLRQVGDMQKRMQEAQAKITALEVTGEAGAGLVKVVMTGRHDVRRVTIDPTLMSESKDIVEDLIAAAFNDAVRRVEKTTQERLSEATAGLQLPPGVKLPFNF